MRKVEWTEPRVNKVVGVDHLGMRVAGETAYEKHIDFITTVTWRPRYFSFFCWLIQQAFLEAGGQEGVSECDVNIRKYKRIIKRAEYVIIAATLVLDPDSKYIAGSSNILNKLNFLKEKGEAELVISADHLQADLGGYGIYAGILRSLGLVSGHNGIDVPMPNSIGWYLAASFSENLTDEDEHDILFSEALSLDTIEKLGNKLSLSKLNDQSKQFPGVKRERELLRDSVIDWGSFNSGTGSAARRILTIGLILEFRKSFSGIKPTLDSFRELILYGELSVSNEKKYFAVPDIYSQVLKEWSIYHIHSLSTFALEAFLSGILFYAKEFESGDGVMIPYAGLLNSVTEKTLPKGFQQSSNTEIKNDFSDWWELPLKEIENLFNQNFNNEGNVFLKETDFYQTLRKQVKEDHIADIEGFFHDTFLMYIITVNRIKNLINKFGHEIWIGTNEELRLPPQKLLKHYNHSIDSWDYGKDYFKKVIDELVIKQHRSNALRKLFARPSDDTSKFVLEGPNIIFSGIHYPGTSNPRFYNAMIFLQDLGYLKVSEYSEITADGEELLKRIRQGGM